MNRFILYANPKAFLALSQKLQYVLSVLCVICFLVGLWLCFHAPFDYQQGEMVKLLFIHVPSAWMAVLVYGFLFLASVGGLVFRLPLLFLAAKSSAPIGLCFTIITCLTGMLWGKPIWGVYWVWDARLTSVLVLGFIYVGYLTLWSCLPSHKERITALFACVGFVNIPIIKFSVDWWNGLHQKASITLFAKPTIHPDLLYPLMWMGLSFLLLFGVLFCINMQKEILLAKIKIYKEGGR